MPLPDPVPSPRKSTLRQFKQAMVWMTLLSVVVAAIAVILVSRGAPEIHIHMLAATGLGVFFTVLLGTGLMVLIFLSAQSGHDDEVSRQKEDE